MVLKKKKQRNKRKKTGRDSSLALFFFFLEVEFVRSSPTLLSNVMAFHRSFALSSLVLFGLVTLVCSHGHMMPQQQPHFKDGKHNPAHHKPLSLEKLVIVDTSVYKDLKHFTGEQLAAYGCIFRRWPSVLVYPWASV